MSRPGSRRGGRGPAASAPPDCRRARTPPRRRPPPRSGRRREPGREARLRTRRRSTCHPPSTAETEEQGLRAAAGTRASTGNGRAVAHATQHEPSLCNARASAAFALFHAPPRLQRWIPQISSCSVLTWEPSSSSSSSSSPSLSAPLEAEDSELLDAWSLSPAPRVSCNVGDTEAAERRRGIWEEQLLCPPAPLRQAGRTNLSPQGWGSIRHGEGGDIPEQEGKGSSQTCASSQVIAP